MSDDLKPCPFCGGSAKLICCAHTGKFYIECANCEAMTDVNYDIRQKAITAWNTRPQEDALKGVIDGKEDIIKQLEVRIAELEDALKFYANGDYCEGGGIYGGERNCHEIDFGQIAQQALEGKE